MFRVTNRDGKTTDHDFQGTVQQFVVSYNKGRGMPDGERVEEVAGVAAPVTPAVEVKPKSKSTKSKE
jgi:hypothetical protein